MKSAFRASKHTQQICKQGHLKSGAMVLEHCLLARIYSCKAKLIEVIFFLTLKHKFDISINA